MLVMPAPTTSVRRPRAARGCSLAAAALFVSLAAFEIALAAGAPWGKAAWGGGEANLNQGLRIASVVSAAVDVGFALVVARRGGHRLWAPLPQRWLPAAVWILAAYSALGTLLNAASRSPIERALMVPTSLSLAVLCACVAVFGAKKEPRSGSLPPMIDNRAERAPEGAC
jgi:hypothetical protein